MWEVANDEFTRRSRYPDRESSGVETALKCMQRTCPLSTYNNAPKPRLPEHTENNRDTLSIVFGIFCKDALVVESLAIAWLAWAKNMPLD
jgi:hypothetical protein